jgi:hypothetical protein
MSKKKKITQPEEHEQFTFRNKPAHLSNKDVPEPRDLEAELFPNKRGPKEIIDEYEKEILGVRPKEKPINEKIYNKVFNLGDEHDEKLVNELLNDKKRFRILMWKDTWTVHGHYMAENVDERPVTPTEIDE